jgi:hypothetical protein
MKAFQTGKYQISDLDRIQKIQPLEYANRTILKRLNYLIGFIKKLKPEILQSFVSKLNNKFFQFLEGSYTTEEIRIPEEIIGDLIHLKLYPNLLQNCLLYYLQLLNFVNTKNWTKDIIKVSNRRHIQSFLYHRYYNAQVLTEIIERNQAVKLFKDYITAYVKSTSSKKPIYETLEEFRSARMPQAGEPPNIGWVIVQGIIENGKYPQRKDTCMWDDAIKELPDIELRHLAACYGDFQSYNNINENFILTMEHTIVADDPYCSCITHDTRINNDFTHPAYTI